MTAPLMPKRLIAKLQLNIVLAAGMLLGVLSCDSRASDQNANVLPPFSSGSPLRKDSTQNMKVKIGSKTFTATLANTAAAAKLKAALPLTLKMSELNGNEK